MHQIDIATKTDLLKILGIKSRLAKRLIIGYEEVPESERQLKKGITKDIATTRMKKRKKSVKPVSKVNKKSI